MKISLNWLKKYIVFSLSPKELAHRLTLSGSEVEKEERVGDDTVFTLEVTPNRPDCLNYIGIAREISAILNKPLKKPKIKRPVFKKGCCDIFVEDVKDCKRYIGAILTDVKIAHSCPEIQKNLKAVDLRPINNVVDITNFCLMETGQPMHAFDLDKLEGKKVIVRRAKPGEKIVAINEVEYTLDDSVLVIADARKPVAIAGVMGGKDTEVSSATKNILLESAHFDPALIRRTSRKLGLRSDSSYRFERGVDIDMVEKASWRAVGLMLECAGGQASAIRDVYQKAKKKTQKPILLDCLKIEKFLGTAVTSSKIKNILKKLEFSVRSKSKNILLATPPGFRSDIQADVDVIEEIARIIGFDRLTMRTPMIKADNIPLSARRIFKKKVAQALIQSGLNEAISYALVSAKALESTGFSSLPVIRNQNPLTEDQEILRPCLLPSLLQVVAGNIKKSQKDLHLFEIGKIYSPGQEKDTVAIIQTGSRAYDWRVGKPQRIDFYDIKGSVESLLQGLRLTDYQFLKQVHESFAIGQYAEISVKGKKAGFIGKIESNVLARWEIKHQDVFYAQVDVNALEQAQQKIVYFQPMSDYPCSTRDISLSVTQDICFEDVKKVIEACKKDILKEIRFVDQYLGDQVARGQRGITISLTYQSNQRTLTESEVEQAHQEICCALASQLKAVKR